MKRLAVVVLGVFAVLLLSAHPNLAQAKRVEMKINGYFCGN